MTDPIVSINYSDEAIRDRLTQLSQRLSDLTSVMEDIGHFGLLQHDKRFDREVDFRGNPLLPDSRRTIAYKKANGLILKVLQATGLMRSRTTYQSTSNSVTITNEDSKAAKHQLGVGVPKREFLGINPVEDMPVIINEITSYLIVS